MSYGRSSLAIGAIVAAALSAPLVQQQTQQTQTLEVEQPRRRKREQRRTALLKAGRQYSPNGGHRRKRAIREARLRKFGTKKHGRYR